MSAPEIPNDTDKKSALACLRNNKLAKAQSLYARIVESDPKDGRSRFLLGIVYSRQGELQRAEQHIRKALDIEPELAEGWLKLGQICGLQGRYQEAEQHLLRSLELNPAMLAARESLGQVYTRMGRLDSAITQFQQVVDRMPDRAAAVSGLATALHLAGQLSQAHQVGMHALSLASDDVATLVRVGQICRDMGDIEEALSYFRKALLLSPGYLPAKYNEAEALERMGRPEEALALLEPLPPDLHNNPVLLILYARICNRLKIDAPLVSMFEKALGNPSLNYQERELIQFMLGDLYDEQERYGDAFAQKQAANDSVWRRLDDSKYQDPMEGIIACFDSIGFSSLPKAEAGDLNPIFIVGMPRSGTSLVEQILASHPQVHGAGELNFIAAIAMKMGLGNKSFNPTAESLRGMARQYRDAVAENSGGAEYITDKMPHNFLYLGLIAQLFPNARIIHTKRNPLDTCLSCYFQSFSGAHKYSYDLKRLAAYYRAYEKMMDHWQRLGIAFLNVQYEDLVRDTERVSRQMIEYCGLEWNEACLRFYETSRLTETASYNQVDRPVYSTSIERWKFYEEFLGPLKEGLELDSPPQSKGSDPFNRV